MIATRLAKIRTARWIFAHLKQKIDCNDSKDLKIINKLEVRPPNIINGID